MNNFDSREKIALFIDGANLYAAAKSELEEDLQQREAFIFDTGYGTG